LVLQNYDRPPEIAYFVDTCIALQLQSTPGPYGQGYNGPAQAPSLFPTQHPQSATKPFNSPVVSNFYPANSVAKPSIPQPFTPAVVPPKPFSPAPSPLAASQPSGGFGNPGQPSIQTVAGASTVSGMFFIFVFICGLFNYALLSSLYIALSKYVGFFIYMYCYYKDIEHFEQTACLKCSVCCRVIKNLLEYYIVVHA
jgi:hypothetical protein